MRINIGFVGVDPIESVVELAKLADTSGLDGVVFSEHLGFHDGVVPAAISLRETSQLEVGIVGIGAASRHPGLLAMELASLAELGNGRFRAQVGTGAASLVDRIGGSRARPIPLVRSLVETTRALLNGETVSGDLPAGVFDGFGLTSVDATGIHPHSGPTVPIDVMAIQPAMLRLAANVGDGAVLSGGCSEQFLRAAVDTLVQELKAAGRKREDFRISAFSYCVVAPDAEKYAGAVRRVLGSYAPEGAAKIMTGVMDGEAYVKASAIDRQKAVEHFITLDVMKSVAVIANDADGLKDALSIYERAGVDSVVLSLVGPLETRAYAVECMASMKRS